jgi:hypothetical protein
MLAAGLPNVIKKITKKPASEILLCLMNSSYLPDAQK